MRIKRTHPSVEPLDRRLMMAATRDPWVKPFTADSIWNTSIGDAAQFVPANLGLLGYLDGDNNYLYRENSADPLKRVIQPEGYPTPIYIRVAPTLSQATGPNNAAAWLKDDGRTIKQISKFSVDPGQNPVGYATPDDDIISGNGRFGSHLGSGLSGLGGTLRTGELTGSEPIGHALGIEIDFAQMWRDNSNRANMAQTYRWPADRSDGNFGGTANTSFTGVPNHTGTVEGLAQGALLALPPSVTEGGLGLSTVAGKKVFRALMDYGAYVVDSSNNNPAYRPNGGFYANITIEPAAKAEFSSVNAYSFATPSSSTINSTGAAAWLADMRAIYANLALVANNAPDAIGGGGTTRRQPPPAPFGVSLPDPPSGLTVTSTLPNSVSLFWTDNAANETGYVVERTTDRSFGTNLITFAMLPADTTSYVDSAPVGATYFYRVHSANDSGNSVDSPAARYTNARTTSSLAGAGSATNAGTVLSSLATGNPGSTAGFQQSAVFAFQLPAVGNVANPFDNATFTVTSPGQSNPFAFNAGNKYALVGLTNIADAPAVQGSFYTDAGTVLNSSFISPATFGGNLGANQSVTLTQDVKAWLNAQYAGGANAGKYVLLRVTSSFANAIFSRVNFTGDSTDPALRPALRYTLVNFAPNAAPSNLSATAVSSSKINLTWTDNATNETSYVLERASNATFTSGIVRVTLPANATSYSATGLAQSAKYFFRVRATNAVGASDNSNVANATTLLAPPTSPTGLTGSVLSRTQIRLNWKDNSVIETGFYVEVSSDGGRSYRVLATLGVNAETYTASGLIANTSYAFRVRAFNAAGPSLNYTNVLSLKTLR